MQILPVMMNLKEAFKWLSLSTLLPIAAFLFQFYVSRPYIIVSEINRTHPNPFKHEFIIKNTGMTEAYSLKINLVNPYFITIGDVTYQTKLGGEAKFVDLAKITEINISPQQSFTCTLDEFINFKEQGVGIKEAMITIELKYKDFLHLVPYKGEFVYKTFSEAGELHWMAVGPKYYQKFKQDKW